MMTPAQAHVIGMAVRLPGGVDSLAKLERVMATGENVFSYPSSDRRALGAAAKSPTPIGWLGEEGVLDWDDAFFGMDGDDGLYTKPQQRLAFELAYEALQDALIAPISLRGSATAIVVAANGQDGYNQVIEERMDPHKAHSAKGWAPGTHGSSIAGRLAHHLGTEGPCMAVETACSGGLAALNVAVSALERDECDRAIVIGVTTRLVDHHIDYLHTANMASKTGRSNPFGRDADGMVTSEGVVAVVLQRADASSSASAPSSYGAIRSILVRHQGAAANISMTKTDAQSRLHLDALRRAGVMPGDVSVFEAHGTGTRLGDAVEADAIKATFASAPSPPRSFPLFVSSSKAVFGHTEEAAGLLGLVKTLLSLNKRTVWRHHVPGETCQERFGGEDHRIELAKEQQRIGERRSYLGLIASMGFTGIMAATCVEAFPQADIDVSNRESLSTPRRRSRPFETPFPALFMLSAPSEALLDELAQSCGRFLAAEVDGKSPPASVLADRVFSLQTTLHCGRDQYASRRAIRLSEGQLSVNGVVKALGDAVARESHPENSDEQLLAVHFRNSEPRHAISSPSEESDARLHTLCSEMSQRSAIFVEAFGDCLRQWPAKKRLPSTSAFFARVQEKEDLATCHLRRFTVQYALWVYISAHFKDVTAVYGDSQGETLAAVAAGRLSLVDAMEVIVQCADAMQALHHRVPFAMLTFASSPSSTPSSSANGHATTPSTTTTANVARLLSAFKQRRQEVARQSGDDKRARGRTDVELTRFVQASTSAAGPREDIDLLARYLDDIGLSYERCDGPEASLHHSMLRQHWQQSQPDSRHSEAEGHHADATTKGALHRKPRFLSGNGERISEEDGAQTDPLPVWMWQFSQPCRADRSAERLPRSSTKRTDILVVDGGTGDARLTQVPALRGAERSQSSPASPGDMLQMVMAELFEQGHRVEWPRQDHPVQRGAPLPMCLWTRRRLWPTEKPAVPKTDAAVQKKEGVMAVVDPRPGTSLNWSTLEDGGESDSTMVALLPYKSLDHYRLLDILCDALRAAREPFNSAMHLSATTQVDCTESIRTSSSLCIVVLFKKANETTTNIEVHLQPLFAGINERHKLLYARLSRPASQMTPPRSLFRREATAGKTSPRIVQAKPRGLVQYVIELQENWFEAMLSQMHFSILEDLLGERCRNEGGELRCSVSGRLLGMMTEGTDRPLARLVWYNASSGSCGEAQLRSLNGEWLASFTFGPQQRQKEEQQLLQPQPPSAPQRSEDANVVSRSLLPPPVQAQTELLISTDGKETSLEKDANGLWSIARPSLVRLLLSSSGLTFLSELSFENASVEKGQQLQLNVMGEECALLKKGLEEGASPLLSGKLGTTLASQEQLMDSTILDLQSVPQQTRLVHIDHLFGEQFQALTSAKMAIGRLKSLRFGDEDAFMELQGCCDVSEALESALYGALVIPHRDGLMDRTSVYRVRDLKQLRTQSGLVSGILTAHAKLLDWRQHSFSCSLQLYGADGQIVLDIESVTYQRFVCNTSTSLQEVIWQTASTDEEEEEVEELPWMPPVPDVDFMGKSQRERTAAAFKDSEQALVVPVRRGIGAAILSGKLVIKVLLVDISWLEAKIASVLEEMRTDNAATIDLQSVATNVSSSDQDDGLRSLMQSGCCFDVVLAYSSLATNTAAALRCLLCPGGMLVSLEMEQSEGNGWQSILLGSDIDGRDSSVDQSAAMETLASAGYGRVVWYRSSFANTRSALVVARAKGAPEVTNRDGDKSQTLIHLHKMGSEMALRDRIAPVVAESSGGKAVLWLVADNDEDFGSSLGLARCLRNEHAKLDARCALLPSAWSLAERKAALDRLRGSSFIAERELRFTDDGRCLVPRVVVTEGSDSSMGIAFRDDASYLFAGGLSALGIALCEWMYARGARHFVLTSRSGAKTIAGDDDSNVNARRSLEALRRLAGCTVELLACDASDRVAMADLVNSLQMPLAGVWLMPLVLRDAPLLQQTAENFKTSYEVKLEPVRVLHSILDTDKLDFVAFFSTVSTLAGIPSQSNYVAASLAAEEIVNALPNGLSLTVPALDDIGAFYRNFVLDRQGKFRLVRNQLRGLRTSSHHLLHFFDVAFTRFVESRSMAWGAKSRRATYAPDLDWTLLKEEFAQLNMVLPHYAEHLVRADETAGDEGGVYDSKSSSGGEQGGLDAILAEVLGLSDRDGLLASKDGVALTKLGVESFTSMMLSARIKQVFNVEVPPHVMLNDMSLRQLRTLVDQQQQQQQQQQHQRPSRSPAAPFEEKCLVEVRAGKGTPVVHESTSSFLHDGLGQITAFSDLDKSLTRPIYAVRPNKRALSSTTPDEVARVYSAALIDEFGKEAAIDIVAYSGSSLIGPLLAISLKEAGATMGRLAMVDYAPGVTRQISPAGTIGRRSIEDLKADAAHLIAQCAELDIYGPPERIENRRKLAKELRQRCDNPFDAQLRRFVEMARDHEELVRSNAAYVALQGEITLFKAADGFGRALAMTAGTDEDVASDLGLRNALQEAQSKASVRLVELDGTGHYSILADPRLAREIQQWL